MTPDGPRLWRPVATAAASLALLTLAVAAEWSPVIRLDGWLSTQAFDATHGHAGRVEVTSLAFAVRTPQVALRSVG